LTMNSFSAHDKDEFNPMTAKTAHPAFHTNCQTNGPAAEMSYAYSLPLSEVGS
ncbi:hypothetical protein AVEN_62828-1, partial [Araneus ventricosus]